MLFCLCACECDSNTAISYGEHQGQWCTRLARPFYCKFWRSVFRNLCACVLFPASTSMCFCSNNPSRYKYTPGRANICGAFVACARSPLCLLRPIAVANINNKQRAPDIRDVSVRCEQASKKTDLTKTYTYRLIIFFISSLTSTISTNKN